MASLCEHISLSAVSFLAASCAILTYGAHQIEHAPRPQQEIHGEGK